MEDNYSHSNTFARVVFIVFGGLITGILMFIAAVFLYENSFAGKIYRGISIDTVEVGGLTPTEAAAKLEAEIRYPFDTSFVFTYEGRQWQATPQQLGFHPQTADMTSAAYSIGRTGGLADQITERLSRHIMRRSADKLLAASIHHQQMAVLNAGMEMHLIRAQLLV